MQTSTVTSAAKALGIRFLRAYKQKGAIKLYSAVHVKKCRCCKKVSYVRPDWRVLKKLGDALGDGYFVSIRAGTGIWSIYVRPVEGSLN